MELGGNPDALRMSLIAVAAYPRVAISFCVASRISSRDCSPCNCFLVGFASVGIITDRLAALPSVKPMRDLAIFFFFAVSSRSANQWQAWAVLETTRPAELIGLFPPGTRPDVDGTLMVGGCRFDDVADQFGTPAIVVSEDALRQRARDYLNAFRGRWPRSDVAFASKSFPCTAVQRVMVEEGLHLDVAGGGEILTAIKAGADPAR